VSRKPATKKERHENRSQKATQHSPETASSHFLRALVDEVDVLDQKTEERHNGLALHNVSRQTESEREREGGKKGGKEGGRGEGRREGDPEAPTIRTSMFSLSSSR
jgi:hypothetical protein